MRGAVMLRELVFSDLTARGKSPAIAKEWGAIVNEFEEVCGYKESYSRADLTLYLGHLRRRGLAQSTIDKNLKAIRLLSQIQGWEFPSLSLRKVTPDEIRRPTLSKDDIGITIVMGKSLLAPPELSYLALSTTYGLRRIEMARLKPQDISPETLTIHTAKGGAKTTQLVPDEIRPYLEGFKPYKPDTLTHVFHRIALATGLNATGGFGWHSIRRSLATELILADASALNVIRFMRWSEPSIRRELGMLTIYAVRDQARIDEAIFKIHPFLPYWRGPGPGERK